jgi:hypothetical protein
MTPRLRETAGGASCIQNPPVRTGVVRRIEARTDEGQPSRLIVRIGHCPAMVFSDRLQVSPKARVRVRKRPRHDIHGGFE